jgi:hypothetical protein
LPIERLPFFGTEFAPFVAEPLSLWLQRPFYEGTMILRRAETDTGVSIPLTTLITDENNFATTETQNGGIDSFHPVCLPLKMRKAGRTNLRSEHRLCLFTLQNYFSTMLLHPFKGLEWHKEKKHRHRRHLSLLLKGLPVTSQIESSA